jgi:hypothetical protein
MAHAYIFRSMIMQAQTRQLGTQQSCYHEQDPFWQLIPCPALRFVSEPQSTFGEAILYISKLCWCIQSPKGEKQIPRRREILLHSNCHMQGKTSWMLDDFLSFPAGEAPMNVASELRQYTVHLST